MMTRVLLRFGTLLATLTAVTLLATSALASSPAGLTKPPPPPPEPLIWTEDSVRGAYSHTWESAVAAVAAHEEAGYDDWRFPTLDEAIDSLYDGSWGTRPGGDGGRVGYWTADRRGNWAWVYIVTFGEGGVPIPELTEARRIWAPSTMAEVKAVRP